MERLFAFDFYLKSKLLSTFNGLFLLQKFIPYRISPIKEVLPVLNQKSRFLLYFLKILKIYSSERLEGLLKTWSVDIHQKTLARNIVAFELMSSARRHARGHKHESCRQRVGLLVGDLLCGLDSVARWAVFPPNWAGLEAWLREISGGCGLRVAGF